jgi:Eukaryotic aspartyl protease
VNFETAISDIIVPGLNCTTKYCAGHKPFNTSASSTAVDLKETFDIPDELTRGEQYNETVYIAGIHADSQAIGVADAYSYEYDIDMFPADGLLGMAFQSISTHGKPPVLQTMISQGQLDHPVFAFKLAQNGSELSVGGVNPALYTGDFTYAPVTTEVSRVHLT